MHKKIHNFFTLESLWQIDTPFNRQGNRSTIQIDKFFTNDMRWLMTSCLFLVVEDLPLLTVRNLALKLTLYYTTRMFMPRTAIIRNARNFYATLFFYYTIFIFDDSFYNVIFWSLLVPFLRNFFSTGENLMGFVPFFVRDDSHAISYQLKLISCTFLKILSSEW